MSTIRDEVPAANEVYAADFGDNGALPMPPGRDAAILRCMGARLDPATYAGLAEGDAHIIRDAEGRASNDPIRSLVSSYKLLGTREWFVFHHTDCGMETFTNEIMAGRLAKRLEPASLDADGWHDTGAGVGSVEGKYINFLTIDDLEGCVVDDVQRIRSHPLVPRISPIYGYIFDIRRGRLIDVPEATRAGAGLQAKEIRA